MSNGFPASQQADNHNREANRNFMKRIMYLSTLLALCTVGIALGMSGEMTTGRHVEREDICEVPVGPPQSPQRTNLKMRKAQGVLKSAGRSSDISENLPFMGGTLVYSGAWMQSSTDIGVYSLPTADGQPSSKLFSTDGAYGGIVVDGVYYVSTLYEVVGAPYANAYGYDMETGNKVFERAISPMEVSVSSTVDPTTGTIYAINFNNEANVHRLVTMTHSTTAWTSAQIKDLTGSWNSISCDASGQLYGVRRIGSRDAEGNVVCTDAMLCKINKNTGSVVEIGRLGVAPRYQTDAEFDPQSGLLYMTVSDGSSSYLATVDVKTGTATRVLDFPDNEEFMGLYFMAPPAPGLPGDPVDLVVDVVSSTLSGTISFTAPTADNQGNSEGTLEYVVKDNGEKIAGGTCAYAETVTVPVTVTEGHHIFTVRVSNAIGSSKEISVEQNFEQRPDVVISLPYANDFEFEGNNFNFDGFSIIDSNDDGVKWNTYSSFMDGCSARVGFHTGVDLDDWMILPAVYMETGKLYKVGFSTWSHKENFKELIEVRWGSLPTAAGMTEQLVPQTEVPGPSDNKISLGGNITVPEDGYYYIGFHALTKSDSNYYLYVDDISIQAEQNTVMPEEITDLTVMAAPDMSLKATVSGTLPTTDIGGGALETITSLEVYRDEEHIVTLTDNLVPGQKFSYIDESVTGGQHLYTVYVCNAFGRSAGTSKSAFVGYAKPAVVQSATIQEVSDRKLQVTWQPVGKDIYNMPLPEHAVTYNIYCMHDTVSEMVAKNIQESSYTFVVDIPQGRQEFVKVYVTASTTAGEGEGVYSNFLPIGTVMDGYRESFADRTISTPLLEELLKGTDASWMVYGEDVGIPAQDNDNGFIAMTTQEVDGSSALVTGKLTLAGIQNPGVSFYTYSITGDDGAPDNNTLAVYARAFGNEVWTEVMPSTTVWELCGKRPNVWGRGMADLGEFAGKVIQLRFVATTKVYASTVVDNIRTCSIVEHDLSVNSIKAPRKVKPGDSFDVEVTVLNEGTAEASGYDIELYADNELVATKKVSTLAPGEIRTDKLGTVMHVLAEEPVAYHAVVVYAQDMVALGNESEKVTVLPKVSPYPAVSNLTGHLVEGNAVVLEWSVPDIPKGFAEVVTEGFETSESFSNDVEDWLFIDEDGMPVGGIRNVEIPGIKPFVTPASFFVMDNALATADVSFEAHGGDKTLCALYRSDDKQVSDWAISPILSGKAQTISFYARSFSSRYLEKLELLYSVGSQYPSSFMEVKTIYPVPYGEWTRYEFDVPEGARYFAFHSCGSNTFMLMIDDVTFEHGSENDLLAIEGYNIYRNGKRINASPVKETVYNDKDMPSGKSEYQVTVVYQDRGEGPGSNKVSMETSGLNDLNADTIIIVEGKSVVVRGAEGRRVYVAGTDGTVWFDGIGDQETRVPLASGVYVVKTCNKTAKVIVR